MVMVAGALYYALAKEREGAPSSLPRCSCPFSLFFPSFSVPVLNEDAGGNEDTQPDAKKEQKS